MKISEIVVSKVKGTHEPDPLFGLHIPIRLAVGGIDCSEMLGWRPEWHEFVEDDFTMGILNEDGTKGLNSYIYGSERLMVFCQWATENYGDESTARQLEQYWVEFQEYEKSHLMELYSKPVPDEDRHLYITPGQADEYPWTILYGDNSEWKAARREWREKERANRTQPPG